MRNSQIYIGFSNDLKERIKKHRTGKVLTTKKYLPVKLVYYEAYLSEGDAKRREKMIKQFGSSWSHIKKRIKDSLKDSQGRGQPPR